MISPCMWMSMQLSDPSKHVPGLVENCAACAVGTVASIASAAMVAVSNFFTVHTVGLSELAGFIEYRRFAGQRSMLVISRQSAGQNHKNSLGHVPGATKRALMGRRGRLRYSPPP